MKCAILGFGNPVRGDDAVGCQVIENSTKSSIMKKIISVYLIWVQMDLKFYLHFQDTIKL